MSLATAIDDLLAHVPATEGPSRWCAEWQDCFDRLDEKVWVEACLLGLEGKLPREEPRNATFWGKTKLPVLGKFNPDSGAIFVPAGLLAWRNSLLALRALAEAKERTPHAGSGVQRMPANEAKVEPEDVPAELRELGRADGPILTATYLATTGGWDISSVELTKAFQARELTYRLKVGNAYAYLYTELFRLRARQADRKN